MAVRSEEPHDDINPLLDDGHARVLSGSERQPIDVRFASAQLALHGRAGDKLLHRRRCLRRFLRRLMPQARTIGTRRGFDEGRRSPDRERQRARETIKRSPDEGQTHETGDDRG
ncbi:MAG: hypothetical protein RML74_04800 [Acidobacteriota bacterium]|nr:hypothetical protein [Acidobacteriota bacterium]